MELGPDEEKEIEALLEYPDLVLHQYSFRKQVGKVLDLELGLCDPEGVVNVPETAFAFLDVGFE